MNPVVAALIGSTVTGLATLVIALVSVAVGRGGRRADIAQKVSDAWDPVFKNMNEQLDDVKGECTACRTELAAIKKVLRATVRAIDSKDPTTIEAAITAARELI